MKGKLYLIPTPLGDYSPQTVLPYTVTDRIQTIRRYFVEDIRSARRFLSAAGLSGRIPELEFWEISEHTSREEIEKYAVMLGQEDAGLISEAGLPAVADPGAMLVEMAHSRDIEVVPMVGPSSLMMALMSSGLNGQNFAFNGYLPVKTDARRAAVLNLEKTAATRGQSQIIIETPYRNDALLKDILSVCKPQTKLCIAADITCESQMIKTRSIAQWNKEPITIGKRPCVFIIGR